MSQQCDSNSTGESHRNLNSMPSPRRMLEHAKCDSTYGLVCLQIFAMPGYESTWACTLDESTRSPRVKEHSCYGSFCSMQG